MIIETETIPAGDLSIDIDWRDLSEENKEYLRDKFEISEDNEPMFLRFFDGEVWVEYKKLL